MTGSRGKVTNSVRLLRVFEHTQRQEGSRPERRDSGSVRFYLEAIGHTSRHFSRDSAEH
jgi:hypothetical protein